MAKRTKEEVVEIKPLNQKIAIFTIEGTRPYVQNAFSQKAREEIRTTQEAGSTSKGKKKREPKDFHQMYEDAQHKDTDGKYGIPCAGLRNAMISACRTAGFVMSRAKLAFEIEPDGFDSIDMMPLSHIIKGEPREVTHYVRIQQTINLVARPMWDPGWQATVRVKYDADMFTLADITNLLMRAGAQVGIGEGRNDSKNSAGVGWGLFKLLDKAETHDAA